MFLLLGDVGALVAAPALAAAPAPFSLEIAANQAVFQVSALKPGPVGQRCLVLQAVNGSADVALLSAQAGGTGLASYLDLMIEQGPANAAANCATMPATLLYAGSLEQLAAGHPDAARGLPIAFAPASSDTALRITVSLRDDNRAQGLDAQATFGFQADDTSVAAVPATTTTIAPGSPGTTSAAGSRPTSPVTTAPASNVTAPGASTGAGSTTTAGTTTAPSVPTATRGGQTAPAGRGTTVPSAASRQLTDPSGPASIVVSDPTAPKDSESTWSSIPEAVRTTVALTAKASSVPALFLGVVLVFLILQDRIDRNDPKLARAPLRPDPEILFVPRRQVTT